jgi:hypothetical protein
MNPMHCGLEKTSRFRGVSFYKSGTKPWRASISVRSKLTYIGSFDTEEEAARAYDRKCHEIGRTKNLNFPDDPPPEFPGSVPAFRKELDLAASVEALLERHETATILRVLAMIERFHVENEGADPDE